MKNNGLAVTLALLASPIASWKIPNLAPRAGTEVRNPTGLVAGADRANSGGRCGFAEHGVSCEKPLEVDTDDMMWNANDDKDQDYSWEEEITEKSSWKEKSMSQFPRQANDRPKFGSLPYGAQISSCRRSGTVALTFDDGPDPTLTGDLLDLLNERGVKATFFVNGDNRGRLTDQGKAQYLDRMLANGHQIASHGWSHLNLNEVSTETKRSEITLLEDALAELIGGIPTYFRPPFGSCDGECLSLLEEYGYHVIRWDVDTNDWKQDLQDSKDIVSSAFASMDSAIVLAHDIHEMTVQNLADFMINTAKQEGLELVTLGACMNDPPENWYRDPTTGDQWEGSSLAGGGGGQSLMLKESLQGDKTSSVSSLFTTSTTTSEDAVSGTSTTATSTGCADEDECVESDEQLEATETTSADDEDNGVAARVSGWGCALWASFGVGAFVLS